MEGQRQEAACKSPGRGWLGEGGAENAPLWMGHSAGGRERSYFSFPLPSSLASDPQGPDTPGHQGAWKAEKGRIWSELQQSSQVANRAEKERQLRGGSGEAPVSGRV